MRISDWSSDVCSSDLDLVLGFKVDALRLQRPVIYTGVYIHLGQPLVDMIGPGLAPFLQQRRAVPLAHLLADALRSNLAHLQHDMSVRLGFIVLAQYPMDIHALAHTRKRGGVGKR